MTVAYWHWRDQRVLPPFVQSACVFGSPIRKPHNFTSEERSRGHQCTRSYCSARFPLNYIAQNYTILTLQEMLPSSNAGMFCSFDWWISFWKIPEWGGSLTLTGTPCVSRSWDVSWNESFPRCLHVLLRTPLPSSCGPASLCDTPAPCPARKCRLSLSGWIWPPQGCQFIVCQRRART